MGIKKNKLEVFLDSIDKTPKLDNAELLIMKSRRPEFTMTISKLLLLHYIKKTQNP